jgi:hypothetical protein
VESSFLNQQLIPVPFYFGAATMAIEVAAVVEVT